MAEDPKNEPVADEELEAAAGGRLAGGSAEGVPVSPDDISEQESKIMEEPNIFRKE
jgi:hypothetical protein